MNRITSRSVTAVALVATVGLVASTVAALGPRVPDPIPDLIESGDVAVSLDVVADDLLNPVTATSAPGDRKNLYVVEQNGQIWSVPVHQRRHDHHHRHGPRGHRSQSPRLFADLSEVGLNLGCFGINYDERGLFGLAFHPNYKRNGLVYTFQSQPSEGTPAPPANMCNSTTPDHDNVVTEWRVKKPRSKRATIDMASGREVLRVAHPEFNHNGGELRFGPDGYLYVSLGDGGAADDQGQGHTDPGGNAQDLSTLLGKVLRIDPNAASQNSGYSIPADNPYVGVSGALEEIWALGFRNPYKMSFDSRTGDLYVADVGQNDLEEINIVTAGGNYGWPVKEGSFAFDQNGADPGFVTADVINGPYIDPIAEYDHCKGPVDPDLVGPCAEREGVAIVGGFVYRGREIKELRGHYVFGEYSTSFFASAGRLLYVDDDQQVKEFVIDGQDELGLGLLGIGQDARGELYVMGKSGAVPGNTGITDPTNTTGVVLRIGESHD